MQITYTKENLRLTIGYRDGIYRLDTPCWQFSDFEELKAYADKKHIEHRTIEEMVNHPDIRKMIEDRINDYQKGLASYEQIKRFVLLPKAFTTESGELTNTLKIRRAVINKRYALLIDAMYAADYRKKKTNNE